MDHSRWPSHLKIVLEKFLVLLFSAKLLSLVYADYYRQILDAFI